MRSSTCAPFCKKGIPAKIGLNCSEVVRRRLLREHLELEHPGKTMRALSSTAGWRRGFYLNASLGRTPVAPTHALTTFVMPNKVSPSKKRFAAGKYRWCWERWWHCTSCHKAESGAYGDSAERRHNGWKADCKTPWTTRCQTARRKLLCSIKERMKDIIEDEDKNVKKALEGVRRLLSNYPGCVSTQ